MTTFVPDGVIWAAAGTGLAQAVAPEVPDSRARRTVEQWAGIAAYAGQRPSDPTQDRARELAALFAASGVEHLVALAGADADALLAAAGRVLGDDVRRAAGIEVREVVPADLVAAVLARCLAWYDEDVAAAAPLLSVFTGHGTDVDESPPSIDPDLLARLGRWLSGKVGATVNVDRAVTISGGFSRLMLDVTWSSERGSTRAVVRIEQGGMFASEGGREVVVMRAVAASGYPVPPVLWEEADAAVLGEPFFVMAWVDGAARLDDEALDDVLRGVAQLHALDRATVDAVAAIDGLAPGAKAQAAIAAQLEHWHRVYLASAPHPVPLLERGFAWLAVHLSPTGPPVVVHGDPGPGNALHDGSGIAAVIDWEFAHAGDAAEDWSYLALIRGRRMMTPAEWKERLRRTVGLHYDDDVWTSWEAYNGVKGACVNLTALDVFAASPRPTADHLAIGVAVHLRFLGRVVDLTGARGVA
jgi:aminoglycoside phosphotransferase (APT) family kinase protein